MDNIIKCKDCQTLVVMDYADDTLCYKCKRKSDLHYQNYSRPEQEKREFQHGDVDMLLQSVNNDIRVLEGKRGLEFGRNYLDFHDSHALNKAHLMRRIINDWIDKGGFQ